MKLTLLLFLICFTVFQQLSASEFYLKTFGNPRNNAVIFLHGGPGFNSGNFEVTTAQALSDAGLFVIVYDRRGEGRSLDANAKYTFQESIEDLKKIFDEFGLKKASLIGHSFGGMLAIKFTQAYPNLVNNIYMAGAPLDLQASFRNIIHRVKQNYTEKNDTINLKSINALAAMDTTALMYSSFCFMHAMQNGFYTPKEILPEAKLIYDKMKQDSIMKSLPKMGFQAPQGFWKNEHYTTLNLSEQLIKLVKSGINVFGIYGTDDGLYSANQIEYLASIIGKSKVLYLDNCSHNVFIDRQKDFISSINSNEIKK